MWTFCLAELPPGSHVGGAFEGLRAELEGFPLLLRGLFTSLPVSSWLDSRQRGWRRVWQQILRIRAFVWRRGDMRLHWHHFLSGLTQTPESDVCLYVPSFIHESVWRSSSVFWLNCPQSFCSASHQVLSKRRIPFYWGASGGDLCRP